MPRKSTGVDGRSVTIPAGWRGLQGSDGHMAAVRPGARGLQGSDGRMVEVQCGWRGLQGLAGRLVAVSPGARGLQGTDGRLAAIQAGARGLQGTDGRMIAVPAGYRGLQGPDGRLVAIAPGKRGIPDARGRLRNKIEGQGATPIRLPERDANRRFTSHPLARNFGTRVTRWLRLLLLRPMLTERSSRSIPPEARSTPFWSIHSRGGGVASCAKAGRAVAVDASSAPTKYRYATNWSYPSLHPTTDAALQSGRRRVGRAGGRLVVRLAARSIV
jgi:hypothetical protein